MDKPKTFLKQLLAQPKPKFEWTGGQLEDKWFYLNGGVAVKMSKETKEKPSAAALQEKNHYETGLQLLQDAIEHSANPAVPLDNIQIIQSSLPMDSILQTSGLSIGGSCLTLNAKYAEGHYGEICAMGSMAQTPIGLLCALTPNHQKGVISQIFMHGKIKTVANLLIGLYYAKNTAPPDIPEEPMFSFEGIANPFSKQSQQNFKEGQMWSPKLDENGRLVPDGVIVDFPKGHKTTLEQMAGWHIPGVVAPLIKEVTFGVAPENKLQNLKEKAGSYNPKNGLEAVVLGNNPTKLDIELFWNIVSLEYDKLTTNAIEEAIVKTFQNAIWKGLVGAVEADKWAKPIMEMAGAICIEASKHPEVFATASKVNAQASKQATVDGLFKEIGSSAMKVAEELEKWKGIMADGTVAYDELSEELAKDQAKLEALAFNKQLKENKKKNALTMEKLNELVELVSKTENVIEASPDQISWKDKKLGVSIHYDLADAKLALVLNLDSWNYFDVQPATAAVVIHKVKSALSGSQYTQNFFCPTPHFYSMVKSIVDTAVKALSPKMPF